MYKQSEGIMQRSFAQSPRMETFHKTPINMTARVSALRQPPPLPRILGVAALLLAPQLKCKTTPITNRGPYNLTPPFQTAFLIPGSPGRDFKIVVFPAGRLDGWSHDAGEGRSRPGSLSEEEQHLPRGQWGSALP